MNNRIATLILAHKKHTLISSTKSLVSLRPITLKLILAYVIGLAVGTEIKTTRWNEYLSTNQHLRYDIN